MNTVAPGATRTPINEQAPDAITALTDVIPARRAGTPKDVAAAVAWLVLSKRLFGVRGGGAAYRAEHATESLLSVERAAVASRA